MNGGRVVIASLTLPGTERAAVQARAFVRGALGPGHPSLDDVRTCVNEAFTNAVEHTGSGRGGKVGLLLLAAGAEIIAEVADDGAGGAGPFLRDEPLAENGRGLWMIDALALGWGVRRDGARTVVWMRFPGPPPSGAAVPA
ncbi:ATP-binding protein [Actinomadura viridis]|uniref:Anti-sigma regulatory factor (Ser/Thr protein kinase) n=1 Tax=Actinomadura viridis TaxID=58110 RepID=A0A931GIE5_9ACTN|nr:ATP-binding protein [Actinomadura viridis]MBG6088503.1 anti-sigma regulatory factor (Ser/Thr protein kinase) [Actinomadura viridis]